jgi:short subunit fatty acids transporter
MSAAAPPAEATEEAPIAKPPGIMTLVKALAAISVLVLLQLVGVSMLIPSAEETTKIAEKLASADAAHEAEEENAATVDHEEHAKNAGHGGKSAHDMHEVKLGSYHVVTFNTDTGKSLNIDFELYGTVLAKEEQEFTHLFEANKVRLREQILVTVRGTDVTDLSDPDLGLLKRQILEKTNRTLGKPLLSEAIFSKFSFIER